MKIEKIGLYDRPHFHTHLDGDTLGVRGRNERQQVGQRLSRSRVRVDDHVAIFRHQAADRRYLDLERASAISCRSSSLATKLVEYGMWYGIRYSGTVRAKRPTRNAFARALNRRHLDLERIHPVHCHAQKNIDIRYMWPQL